MQPLVSSLRSCFIRCEQGDIIGGLLFLLSGATNAHLVVYPIPMICEAYFDFPVGTGSVSVPTGVNTTVHVEFYCILEFSFMFSGVSSAPLNPREGLSMDLQGGWMFLLTLPVPPASSPFLLVLCPDPGWVDTLHPSFSSIVSAQELDWVHLCCSFLYCNLEISNL